MVRNGGPGEDVFAVLKLEQEEFNTYDKQVPCNGVALPAASTNSDSGGGIAINEDRGLEVFQEGVYPGNVCGVEVKQFECVFNEFKRDAVKGLGKINLEHEAGSLCVLAC